MTAIEGAVLDACVLVPASLRDTLLRLAESPALYRPKWSDAIMQEMCRTLEGKMGLSPRQTRYLEQQLKRHFSDAWISGYEALLPQLRNDPGDRHVLAAAIKGRIKTIVTFNKRHFPPHSTREWAVEAVGPSAFLERLYTMAPELVCDRIREQAANLERTLPEQLNVLARAVPSFIAIVRRDLGIRDEDAHGSG
jgi:predicted nucleic acid-binding protein